MSNNKHTIAEMEQQIQDLQKTMAIPGVPADEIAIYRNTIARIQAAIRNQQTPQQTHTLEIRSDAPGINVLTTKRKMTRADEITNYPDPPTRIITRHAGPAPTTSPITSTIEVEHKTDPHNPRITITWSDGYTITVDETAARSNFTNRMRDTCNLKCVASQNRFEKIWKYDAPWRAAGFYKALTWFWDGTAPALNQIGITRPTETYRRIFGIITENALK